MPHCDHSMATQNDVRRIALSVPEVEEAADRFASSVRNKGKLKGFAWVWLERVEPRKARVPQPDVIAVRVANLGDKAALISAERRSSAPSCTTTASRRSSFA
jgi:hypothetical protein